MDYKKATEELKKYSCEFRKELKLRKFLRMKNLDEKKIQNAVINYSHLILPID
jgi:hypothetical protein